VPTEALVWEALGRVTDPEYPVSIVDLGLVYSVDVREGTAEVRMTLTSIGCPAIDMIAEDVRAEVAKVPGVREARVDVVWSPAWTKDRITERGRRMLAHYGVVD
jgi:phenylacetate-CoA oxygenase PaaJ subunit